MGLSFEIRYKKGVNNKEVDASRKGEEKGVECLAIDEVTPLCVGEVTVSYQADKEAKGKIAALLLNNTVEQDYQFLNGLLKYKSRIYISSYGEVRRKLIAAIHSSQEEGIQGVQASIHMAKQYFFEARNEQRN